MEFIDAPKLSQANLDEAGKQKLAEIILEGAFKQLFEDGLFHGDPHPGDLLVLPGPVLALIDFGLVGRVSRQRSARHADLSGVGGGPQRRGVCGAHSLPNRRP